MRCLLKQSFLQFLFIALVISISACSDGGNSTGDEIAQANGQPTSKNTGTEEIPDTKVCPDKPADVILNFENELSSQNDRAAYLHYLICQLNLDIELSPILAERGAVLKVVGIDKLESFKNASRKQLRNGFFSNSPLPNYLDIYTTVTKVISGAQVTVLLRFNDPEKFNDFGLFTDKQADSIHVKWLEGGYEDQAYSALSQVYVINGCNPHYEHKWDRLLPTEDNFGLFAGYSGFNHCKNKVIAVNPAWIELAKTYYSPYGFERGGYQPSSFEYEDYIRTELYGSRSEKYENYMKTLAQKMAFDELTTGEFPEKIDQYLADKEMLLWKRIAEDEAKFINILDFLTSRKHRYEFDFD